MRHPLLVTALSVTLLATAGWANEDPASSQQAAPRPQAEPRRGSDPERGRQPQSPPPSAGPDERQRAAPRQPAPEREGRRTAPERRTPAPPRVVPPQYHRVPRVYYFPPISVQRGFYYHPYFGFYFGPYYGPYYPYPGPLFGPPTFSAGAVRTRVLPKDTHVYVNGYYAGEADDFDGALQRLYVPAGSHEIALHLEGYQPHVVRLFLSPGDTHDIRHQMVRLPPGALNQLPMPPRTLPDGWTNGPVPTPGDRPVSPFGILSIKVRPADALVLVDGEVWLDAAEVPELIVHVPSGWHTVEVRKDGYQTFRTQIEFSEGATTRLNVTLER